MTLIYTDYYDNFLSAQFNRRIDSRQIHPTLIFKEVFRIYILKNHIA